MTRGRTAWLVAGAALTALLAAASARAQQITPDLAAALATARASDELPVLVSISRKVDPGSFRDRDRGRRRSQMVEGLRTHASITQRAVSSFLRRGGARRLTPLWIVNAVAVVARPDVIRALARHPDVDHIELDAAVSVPEVAAGAAAPVEWNLDAIGAPALWALGFTGEQRVVASMDTGVDIHHPDLGPSWRGGANSWFDPSGQHAAPTDVDGHGTATMGILVGGAVSGSSIGVAPGAQWIAAKIFDDAGKGSLSGIHLAFQWLLDPDGDPSTDDAPDVVNNSWDLSGSLGDCVTEFEPDVQALTAAGIPVVFAGGNRGPGPGTSLSPGNYADSFAVGAVDASSRVAGFSSRGPSACDGGLYPRVVAPGVSVRTTDITFGGVFPQSYTYISGTSFAAPHVAGGLTLLASAFPDASVADLEAAIEGTARDIQPDGPDQAAGYGLLDLPAAYALLVATLGEPTTTSSSTTSSSSTTTSTTSSTSTSSSSVTTTTTSTSTTSTSSSSSTTTVTTLSVPPTTACTDGDGDGVCDARDDCPAISDPAQRDLDADGIGDPCDDEDASLTVTRLSAQAARPGRGRIELKIDFRTAGGPDVFDASAGLAVRVRAGALDRAQAWKASECATKGGHILCRSGDGRGVATFSTADAGLHRAAITLGGLTLVGPLASPAVVTLTHGAGIDRRGQIGTCAVRARGVSCRVRGRPARR